MPTTRLNICFYTDDDEDDDCFGFVLDLHPQCSLAKDPEVFTHFSSCFQIMNTDFSGSFQSGLLRA